MKGKIIAIEYNGAPHYEFPNDYHKTRTEFKAQQERDALKRTLCEGRGVTLISVKSRVLLDEELSEITPILAAHGISI